MYNFYSGLLHITILRFFTSRVAPFLVVFSALDGDNFSNPPSGLKPIPITFSLGVPELCRVLLLGGSVDLLELDVLELRLFLFLDLASLSYFAVCSEIYESNHSFH